MSEHAKSIYSRTLQSAPNDFLRCPWRRERRAKHAAQPPRRATTHDHAHEPINEENKQTNEQQVTKEEPILLLNLARITHPRLSYNLEPVRVCSFFYYNLLTRPTPIGKKSTKHPPTSNNNQLRITNNTVACSRERNIPHGTFFVLPWAERTIFLDGKFLDANNNPLVIYWSTFHYFTQTNKQKRFFLLADSFPTWPRRRRRPKTKNKRLLRIF